ncbi:MAG TPA: DEAD/DEAH box helicase [Thermoplasmata archaeon]|nr:DEAD/DEAH box helicase [Thermoplasmata archaeon]
MTSKSVPDPSQRRSVTGLGIPPEVIEVLAREGIRELYPPQAEALPAVMAGSSVVLACPTASGKSLVAYLALVRAARAGRTGLYLVPLRALAQEKFEELQAFTSLGLRIGLSIGDFDLPNDKLEKLDILVATSEKADGLLRRGSTWLDRLGAVVADEVHLLHDPERGPTLEVTLTRLRRRRSELQIVALSATVGNARELSEWLGAECIESEFRPVPLKWGVYHEGRIQFTDLSTRPIPAPGEPLPRLVRTVIEEGGQALVFVNTRRSSEQTAQALAPTTRRLLTVEERELGAQTREELLATAEEETEGIRRLSELVPNGVAFHNASLTNPERRVIERAFRDRRLKALVATPTLAAGINLPARRVIVRDTTRYDDRLGMQAPIPVLEVQQMCGRAGRPRFDKVGEAVLLARSPEEEERYLDTYLSANPEVVVSRLAAEPALRMHLLALVASGEVHSEAELTGFLSETFYGHTLAVSELTYTVAKVRGFLEEHGFLVPGTELRATAFGELTSELYLDPISAVLLRRALERAPRGVRPFALLAAVSATPDLPALFLRRGDEPELFARYSDEEPELLLKPEEEGLTPDLETFLSTLKTAAILEQWIEERPIVEITERFGIGAGDLRAKVEDATWLLFGFSRIAQRFRKDAARPIEELELRVQYGVGDELLDLVRLRGVGRVRGRLLHAAGFSDRESLRAAPRERVVQALKSPVIADQVLAQLRPPHRGRATEPEATPAPVAPNSSPESSARRESKSHRTLDEFPADP